MPVMNIKVSGTTTEHNGKTKAINPDEALAIRGPCVQATMTVSDAQQEALSSSGEMTHSKPGLVMFDTGASATCFDQQAAEEMGLPIIGRGNMISASHANHPVPIYAGRLILPNINLNIERGMGANLMSQGIIALIGRDVMRHGTLFYNGVDGSVSFAI